MFRRWLFYYIGVAQSKPICMKQEVNEFEFKYSGDKHTIDINTLIVTQLHYNTMLCEIKNILYPEVTLNIKIRSFEANSFDVNQIVEIATVAGYRSAAKRCWRFGTRIYQLTTNLKWKKKHQLTTKPPIAI